MMDLEPIRKAANEISKMPDEIKSIGNRVGTLEKTTAVLEKTTEHVVHRVGNLEKTTASVSKQIAGLSGQQYTQASSPMSLNTRGKELSKEMDAAGIASRYKAKLVDKAKSENGGPYQIQESCLDCAADEILRDLEEKDKTTYRHLTDIAYSEGVQVEVLMRIVGIVLRDQVLQAIDQPSKDTAEKTAE